MRILVLTSLYPPLSLGGHGERCRQTVSALARRGHAVQVLTSNHRLPSQALRRERGVRRRLLLESPAADFARILARERANQGFLVDSLAAFRPDCVFVWDMTGLSKSLLFFLQSHGLPCVFDIHSSWLMDDFGTDPWIRWWNGPLPAGRRVQRVLMRLSGRARGLLRRFPLAGPEAVDLAHAFVCGRNLRNRMHVAGFDRGGIEVVHPATDTDLIPVKIRYSTASKLMWAGRLSPEKDPDTAVEAVRRLRERGREISLDLYAQGSPLERKRLRHRINAEGLGAFIHIRHIRPFELPRHFADYDALVSTSGADDFCPMTPIEAVLAGLPLLAARGGAIFDMLREGDHACAFDFGDPEDLAGTLEKFCQKHDHGADMARRARETLQDGHAMDRAVIQIEKRLQAAVRDAR